VTSGWSRRVQFHREHPNVPIFGPSEPDELRKYLVEHRLMAPEDLPFRVTRAGDGNMNCTLRVVTPRRRLIVKQARPWVEKYDHIAAPWDRSHVEAAFYESVVGVSGVEDRMPGLLHADAENHVLVLEDLGDAGDFTSMYRGERLPDDDGAALADYLVRLRRVEAPAHMRHLLRNREMRALNHEHIFQVPLAVANGLALDGITPGLQAAADALKGEQAFVARVTELGARYLADGPALVHGDYFPGSWVKTGRGVAIIDPEFCFLGAAEVDVGAMLAHLILCGEEDGRIDGIERAAAGDRIDRALARRFAGVEIMRRLIGVAQLPLDAPLDRKQDLLDRARQLVLAA
jgi:5-methylthioribose kinase